ncbi:cytochrome P450 [Aspergillus bertholletiae]|uniref:Cytochrome P450 n=1 Tax=Aspergillus bertholletiae TaxID=1226010 RepID=A0A5N7BCS7_9EURO|nr:cytochrome P450 [Aspergillus bertholletiae]
MDVDHVAQTWSVSIYYPLLITGLVLLFWFQQKRIPFPQDAPQVLKEGYPLLGALRFFTDRGNFFHDSVAATRTGNFGFYVGCHQLIGLAGHPGRKTFFESKLLDLTTGYRVLLGTEPPSISKRGHYDEIISYAAKFRRNFIRTMGTESLSDHLPLNIELVHETFREAGSDGLMDVFHDFDVLVHRLTMQNLGVYEIADSQELYQRTYNAYYQIESAKSATRVIFPWLPTPAFITQITAGAKLYQTFSRIIRQRAASEKPQGGALQYLIDSGANTSDILHFVLNAIFASQLNTPIVVSWVVIYLATQPYWMKMVRAEIDAALAKHGSPGETPVDVLKRLKLQQWESEFPCFNACMHESMRLHVTGSAYRMNTSGGDVPITGTKEVVPRDALVFYLLKEVHLDPEIYPEPDKWDPRRFLSENDQSKDTPYSFLAWGDGRHPCLGTRIAKLQMVIIVAHLVSTFDLQLCDAAGRPKDDPPAAEQKYHVTSKPIVGVRVKYCRRSLD